MESEPRDLTSLQRRVTPLATKKAACAGGLFFIAVGRKASPERAAEVTSGHVVRFPKNRHQMIILLPRNLRPAFGFIRHKHWASPFPRHTRPVDNLSSLPDLLEVGNPELKAGVPFWKDAQCGAAYAERFN